MMARMYIEMDHPDGHKWKEWVTSNEVTYEGFHPFPMCGGIRLDGVSYFPYPKPDYVRYEVTE